MNPFFRWIGSIALHWFYRSVRTIGVERIPRSGPILVAMNHPNALVDALLAASIVPRRLRLTAKASLGESLPGALMLRVAGIIPLRRASDETDNARNDPMRNRNAFERMVQELRDGGAILVFPEGKSHNEPALSPLKTGLARAALRARSDGVRGVRIVPIGTTFEQKEEPGTAVVARVGEIIDVDAWPNDDPHALTDELAGRLSAIALTGKVDVAIGAPKHGLAVRIGAWWGEITHRLQIKLARRLAESRSHDEGEPAMFTLAFGFGLIIASYLLTGAVLYHFTGAAISLVVIASMIVGAYCAAYANHPDERRPG